MTETLTGKQVLALLAQDEATEIEFFHDDRWKTVILHDWDLYELLTSRMKFRIKHKPQRRLSVTLANGEVVSWPEPVREPLKDGQKYWYVDSWGIVNCLTWDSHEGNNYYLTFGNIHLTREAAQEHADALRKINTQEATC